MDSTLISVKIVARASRRASRPRSRFGCLNCKKRHIKCDEYPTTCKNCSLAGLACGGPELPLSTIAHTLRKLNLPQVNPDWSPSESRTYHHFSTNLAPLITCGSGRFWIDSVLPAARSHDAIFKALLSVSCFFDLTPAQIAAGAKREDKYYISALRYYASSVKMSIEGHAKQCTSKASTLLLMSSILYFFFELRLGNCENAQRLLLTAFSVVHANRPNLLRSKDFSLLASISLLLHVSIISGIDPTVIPQAHRVSAMVVALGIAASLNASEEYTLHLELLNIMWDVNDVLIGRPPASSVDMQERLDDWYESFRGKESSNGKCDYWPGLFITNQWYLLTKMQWLAFKNKNRTLSIAGQTTLVAILESLEFTTHMLTTKHKMALPWALDVDLIPKFIFLIWFNRDSSTLSRVQNSLDKIEVQKPFIKSAQIYMQRLVNARPQQPTTVEAELFGKKPKILHIYQAWRCAAHLAHGVAVGQ